MQLQSNDPVTMQALRVELADICARKLIPLTGVADLVAVTSAVPEALNRLVAPVPLKTAFVGAMPLHRGVLATIDNGPNALYMHHYRQVNYRLDRTALELAALLESKGFLAIAVAASQTVSTKPMLGHVSHRLLAEWAGLGWRGRNNLLVTEEFGAAVRLISILTDAPLPCDAPLTASGCGDCIACVAACPAGAIGMSPADYNLQACYEQLTKHTHIPFVSQHICGVCQKACLGRRGMPPVSEER